MPFKTRRETLLQSKEWNCFINRKNQKYSIETINEENIEDVISSTINYATLDLIHSIQKLAWVPLAMNKAICDIYIKTY